MKQFIQDKVRKFLTEQVIDDENMNPGMQSLCNTMSVKTYDEVIQRVTAAIGSPQQAPVMWSKISKPLQMLQQSNRQIGAEKHVANNGAHINDPGGMTGDSMVDESNTWWAAIQSTLCEQGSSFV